MGMKPVRTDESAAWSAAVNLRRPRAACALLIQLHVDVPEAALVTDGRQVLLLNVEGIVTLRVGRRSLGPWRPARAVVARPEPAQRASISRARSAACCSSIRSAS